MSSKYVKAEEGGKLDYAARVALNRWQQLKERGLALIKGEPQLLETFQQEPEDPTKVGIDQSITDQFSPEELVAMWEGPHIIDWDHDQIPAYSVS